MKLVRPITINDAALTSSTVLETPPSAYNAGTTYALDDQVSVFSGVNSTVATMYQSLQGSNTGNTPSSSPTYWQELGTAYLAYNGATNYSADAIVTDTTNHKLYQSQQGSNTGHALTDAAWWLELGPSNRWAMFDQKTSTQTTQPLSAEIVLAATGRINTLGLLNLDAASVNVTVMDDATEAYNEDYSLVTTDGITDWFAWFFEPIIRKTDLVVSDIPNVLDPAITITLTDTDSVSIGHCIAGLSRDLGGTVYGAQIGITDYSRKTQDDFGNWYIVERGYNKRGRFGVFMENQNIDFVFNLLSTYRATPILLIGSDAYTSTYLFGLLKDWNIEIQYTSHSAMTIEVDGL